MLPFGFREYMKLKQLLCSVLPKGAVSIYSGTGLEVTTVAL